MKMLHMHRYSYVHAPCFIKKIINVHIMLIFTIIFFVAILFSSPILKIISRYVALGNFISIFCCNFSTTSISQYMYSRASEGSQYWGTTSKGSCIVMKLQNATVAEGMESGCMPSRKMLTHFQIVFWLFWAIMYFLKVRDQSHPTVCFQCLCMCYKFIIRLASIKPGTKDSDILMEQ